MQAGRIIDILGAIVVLAGLAVVAKNPGIVTATGTQFSNALRAAKA